MSRDSPHFGFPVPVKAVPKNVPDFDTEWGEIRADSNTSDYGSHLTHRQRRRHMTYRRSSINKQMFDKQTLWK